MLETIASAFLRFIVWGLSSPGAPFILAIGVVSVIFLALVARIVRQKMAR